MKAIRISLITATITTVLIVAFGIYQYFVLGNTGVINGPGDSGFSFILALLLVEFFLINAVISFFPSVICVFTGKTVNEKFIPLFISIGSILICFALLFTQLLPELDSVNLGQN